MVQTNKLDHTGNDRCFDSVLIYPLGQAIKDDSLGSCGLCVLCVVSIVLEHLSEIRIVNLLEFVNRNCFEIIANG